MLKDQANGVQAACWFGLVISRNYESKNLEMRITRLIAADRGDVLWAGGKADHQVHLGAHDDVIALLGDGRIGFDGAIGVDRRVLPEVERRRQFDGFQAQLDHRFPEVVGAVAVIFLAAQ